MSLRCRSCMLAVSCKRSRKCGWLCDESKYLVFISTFIWCIRSSWLRSETGLSAHVLLTNFANFQLETLLVRENVTVTNLNIEITHSALFSNHLTLFNLPGSCLSPELKETFHVPGTVASLIVVVALKSFGDLFRWHLPLLFFAMAFLGFSETDRSCLQQQEPHLHSLY